ncbi:MAG: NADH-quinone oxidoreductase subunit J [Anaerolineales bacterium]|nr:NADH-quinone oxidoreductase subunit J [Anaerolineales bacterium]
MLGTELALFILIGAIAIFAAVMMLISENAVHSALFLIVNFACVAFLYLMLNAAFLAMVQVTVYAGAIMVLFLFVIMLLGAEKLLPQPNPQFSWLTPVAVGMVVVILFVVSVAILDSELDTNEPEPHNPVVRFIHANSEAEAVDIYLNDQLWASDLEFTQGSDFKEIEAGEYTVKVFSGIDLLTEETVALGGNDVVSLVMLPEAIDGKSLLRVKTSLEPVKERNTSRMTIVNAMACPTDCTVDVLNITDPSDKPTYFAENLGYGEFSPFEILRRDQYISHLYTLGAFPAGVAAAELSGEDAKLASKPTIQLRDVEATDNEDLVWVLMGDSRAEIFRQRGELYQIDNYPAFGSARGVGQLLYVDYMLVFQTIAALLLVAMVGTLILTTDAEIKRTRRNPRRMAAVPGNPTVEEYVQSLRSGAALPEASSTQQLPSGE